MSFSNQSQSQSQSHASSSSSSSSSPPDSSDSDPLSLLTRAISSSRSNHPHSEITTSQLLSKLYSILATNPTNLAILLPIVVNLPHHSIKANHVLNAWVIDFLDLAFNRPSLSQKDKDQLSPLVPPLLLTYLSIDPSNTSPASHQDSKFGKLALQCFASIYQSLFKNICTDKQTPVVEQSKKWKVINQIKRKAMEFIHLNPPEKFLGLKIAAIRALTRVVIVQSRVGGDPRKKAQDFSLSSVPNSHPILKVQELESEATEMMTKIVTVAYTSSLPDMVTCTLTCLVTLSKSRLGQQMGEISLKALLSWTPNALSSCSYLSKKNTEKTLKLALWHFLNNRLVSKEMGKEIGESLEKQRIRIEIEERKNKEERELRAKRKREGILKEISHSHPHGDAEGNSQNDQKRIKVEKENPEGNHLKTDSVAKMGTAGRNPNVEAFLSTGSNPRPSSSPFSSSPSSANQSTLLGPQRNQKERDFFSQFDVSKLEINLLVDLIISSLQSVEEREMINAINSTRENLNKDLSSQPTSTSVSISTSAPASASTSTSQFGHLNGIEGNPTMGNESNLQEMEWRPIDPLKIEVEDDEERLEKLELEWKKSKDQEGEEVEVDEEGQSQGAGGGGGEKRIGNSKDGKDLAQRESNSTLGLETSSPAISSTSTSIGLEHFQLELPKRLTAREQVEIIEESVSRILLTGELQSERSFSGLKELKNIKEAAGAGGLTGGDGEADGEAEGDAEEAFLNGSMASDQAEHSKGELWMMIVIRLITRGFSAPIGITTPAPTATATGTGSVTSENNSDLDSRTVNQEMANEIRKKLLDYISVHFKERYPFAVHWLSEEWIAEKKRTRNRRRRILQDGKNEKGNQAEQLDEKEKEKEARLKSGSSLDGKTDSDSDSISNYSTWLSLLVEKVIEKLDANDNKTLSNFLSHLPTIPDVILRRIGELCLDKKKISIGFTVLREISTTRPKNRELCSEILLNLTRNKDKVVRGAAIITVRGWVSLHYLSVGMLQEKVIMFARENLERLILPKSKETEGPAKDVEMKDVKEEKEAGKEKEKNNEETSEGGQKRDSQEKQQEPAKDVISDPKIPIEQDQDILRLVELPFALSIKLPSMLDEIFQSYVYMSSVVQSSIRKNISPLIRSLGPGNSKLLSLLRNFPKGSDELALHIFQILMEKGRSLPLITLMKNLVENRERDNEEINPRFLVPILPEFNKNEIMKHLPKVVTILNSRSDPKERAEDRNLIKQVFQSIVEMPDEGFGSISTNLPRIKKDDLLTPTELMSVLHFKEKEIGTKVAADAIKICFGMTEVYRSEVLAAVINQLVGEPVLPDLFMRTVITAVSTYKSLTGFVSTNILLELITKKVWQSPLIWKGFIICATQTSPSSSGALMSLPKEQLNEVLQKQPSLRATLREYAMKKAGTNKVRLKALLSLLGEDEDEKSGNKNGGQNNGSANSDANVANGSISNGGENRSRSNTPASSSTFT